MDEDGFDSSNLCDLVDIDISPVGQCHDFNEQDTSFGSMSSQSTTTLSSSSKSNCVVTASTSKQRKRFQEDVLNEIRKIQKQNENDEIVELINHGNRFMQESNKYAKEANEIAKRSLELQEKNNKVFCDFLQFMKNK